MTMLRKPFSIAIAVTLAACATSSNSNSGTSPRSNGGGDVIYEVDAFLVHPEIDGWAAWTERGLEVNGDLIATPGSGCLPDSGWPGLMLFVPGDNPGIWLYGTEPQMSGESFGSAGDEITFDCVVRFDGTTRPGDTVSARMVTKPDPDDNFGFAPAPWHQAGQAPRATMLTPAGSMEWELSRDRSSCWLAGAGEMAWSACLPTAESNGLELKEWGPTPEGLVVQNRWIFELPQLERGDARLWLEAPGRVVVAATTKPGESSVWLRATGTETNEWTSKDVAVPGAVTSVVFDGDEAILLTVDFDAHAYRLIRLDGLGAEVRKLPAKMRPTKLHLSQDGTLWGAGIGAAWRLAED